MTGLLLQALIAIPDTSLHAAVGDGTERRELQFLLYAALRREQMAVAATDGRRGEVGSALGFAQSAYRELQATLIGRNLHPDGLRDAEWTSRDLLRHAIATELRYCEQILYSATGADNEPIAIPEERLPCDRLSPPEPEYAASKDSDTATLLDLLGRARERTDRRLASIPTSAMRRPSMWGRVPIDVRDRLHQLAVHLVEVMIQAEKMLTAAGQAESEARKIVRRLSRTRGLHERCSDLAELARLDALLAPLAGLPIDEPQT